MCWGLGVGGLAPSINVVPSPTCMEQNIQKKKKKPFHAEVKSFR